jgi:hypothetical protein
MVLTIQQYKTDEKSETILIGMSIRPKPKVSAQIK